MSETEEIQQETPPAVLVEATVDKKLKRVKQSCITIFVVAVVALGSFGQPLYSQSDSQWSLNLLPVLTWLMAVYALFFVLFQFKNILKLSATPKTLGILGSLVLFANIACGILGVFPAGAPNQIFPATKSTVWNIDGKDYAIEKTYFLRMNEGDVQYTIDYEYPNAAEIHNDQDALVVALPIMLHACKHKKYGMVRSPSSKPQPAFIGVSIFTRVGNGTKGYRVALPMEEIQKKLK